MTQDTVPHCVLPWELLGRLVQQTKVGVLHSLPLGALLPVPGQAGHGQRELAVENLTWGRLHVGGKAAGLARCF